MSPDREQTLEMLARGSAEWNNWRAKQALAAVIDIRDAWISDVDLTDADLSRCDLRGASFSNATLLGANLSGSELAGANFLRCNLDDAKFTNASAVAAHFQHSRLCGADLRQADFSETQFIHCELSSAVLDGARLIHARLQQADMSDCSLEGADLLGAAMDGATLCKSNLRHTRFIDTALHGADLSHTYCAASTFIHADLSESSFASANLFYTNFTECNLDACDLSMSQWNHAQLCGVDLNTVRGFDSIGPASNTHIDASTYSHSYLRLTDDALARLGVQQVFRQREAKLLPTCFISYTTRDQAFAEQLREDLAAVGVPIWLATEDLKTHNWIETSLQRAIESREKVILILSERCIAREWLAFEVKVALEKEKRSGRTIIIPVGIDLAYRESEIDWVVVIRESRTVIDFEGQYQQGFDAVLRELGETADAMESGQ